jgi:protein-L-isoaspartate(D-aspartate) O-methyltransferase
MATVCRPWLAGVVDAVTAAFEAVPREGFLPRRARRHAAYDGPLDIGNGQTNSQPRTVADMLRLLDVRPGQRVLDVGSGSGWTTALLAHLVGSAGCVRGVEIVPRLVEQGRANLEATGQPWASIQAALPERLVGQLAPGGRMVCPVLGRMTLVVRDADQFRTSVHGHYRFVPLR